MLPGTSTQCILEKQPVLLGPFLSSDTYRCRKKICSAIETRLFARLPMRSHGGRSSNATHEEAGIWPHFRLSCQSNRFERAWTLLAHTYKAYDSRQCRADTLRSVSCYTRNEKGVDRRYRSLKRPISDENAAKGQPGADGEEVIDFSCCTSRWRCPRDFLEAQGSGESDPLALGSAPKKDCAAALGIECATRRSRNKVCRSVQESRSAASRKTSATA